MFFRSIMLIAGEPSGDALAAELVLALKASRQLADMPFPPSFFGAGGSQMAAAGVELAFDLTAHAVFGLSDALRNYGKFRRLFGQLYRAALERTPDVIILVDYAGFNRRFAQAIKRRARAKTGPFANWNPKIVYYVSPQVWASREGRAYQLARDVDLLLSIIPFEKEWYSRRVPRLRVEWVGHPIVDRFSNIDLPARNPSPPRDNSPVDSECQTQRSQTSSQPPYIVLLPGSRDREIRAHLPPMIEAIRLLSKKQVVRARVILPNARLKELAARLMGNAADLELRVGGLAESLLEAAIAVASSGTVTLECAYFGVPTVVIYKTSWITYEIGRRIVRVRHIAMPNIIAGEAVYPELLQNSVTPEAIADEAFDLLTNLPRRKAIEEKLCAVIQSLGTHGASRRAAQAILELAMPDSSRVAKGDAEGTTVYQGGAR